MVVSRASAIICMTLSIISANAQGPSLRFNPLEASIESIHQSLFSRLYTCTEVVQAHLARISTLNPKINSIISLESASLNVAQALDHSLSAGNITGRLFCIPILLKDNYDTRDLPTTGGCLDLGDSRPSEDAPTVQALRREGAVILGKTNLHELALEGLSVSSYGGQTFNPYDFTRTPGGSSGGSGAALAASFSVLATGTDTVNSLRNPASANSLVSVRPTRGLISRSGIIPISYTQDVAGPMARTVSDVAVMLTVMASVGADKQDNATYLTPREYRRLDYTEGLASSTLRGLRVGLVEGFFNRTASSETDPVNDAMDDVVTTLERSGATVVQVNSSVYDANRILKTLDTQQFEYRQEMERYLQDPQLRGSHPRTLQDLYQSGEYLVIPAQYQFVKSALVSSTANASYFGTILPGIGDLSLTLAETFARDDLDVLLYPQQKNLVVKVGSPSQSGRNGILAALTGSPVVALQAGFSQPSQDAPRGVPVGMELLGRPYSEAKLLRIAYRLEQLMHVRRPPVFAEVYVESNNVTRVPALTPQRGTISPVYPIGDL